MKSYAMNISAQTRHDIERAKSAISKMDILANKQTIPMMILAKLFRGYDRSDKWYLGAGKCVDNELFIFTFSSQEEHPRKYFIMDAEYGVFTEEELDEIRTVEENELPVPSDHILKFMNKINLNNMKSLRVALKNSHTFEEDVGKELDWI